MASWRDALTRAALEDVQLLVDAGLAIGRDSLARAGVFPPVPLVVNFAGSVLRLDHNASHLPRAASPAAVADDAIELLRRTAHVTHAVALVAPTRLAKARKDAVEIWIEHREGTALSLIQPYRRPALGGAVTFGAPAAYPADRRIWA